MAKQKQRKNQGRRLRDDNRLLKRWFDVRGLRLEHVWVPTAGDPEAENRSLRLLQHWVQEYLACQDQAEMERKGYRYPPIEPDFDPWSDWFRFRRWIEGKPLTWSYVEEFGELPTTEDLSDEQIAQAVDEITDRLETRNVLVMLHSDVPPRLVFGFLRQELEESRFEVIAPNATTWIDGCSGGCPWCFQRPWCEVGREPGWPEDEREGCIVVPPEIEPYIDDPTFRAARAA
jgi:hypothetical protein